MKDESDPKFFEVSHTADLAIRAVGKDYYGLLRSAEKGLYAVMGLVVNQSRTTKIEFSLPYLDQESLLINYLNELLYYVSTGMAPRLIGLETAHENVHFTTQADEVVHRSRDIKAVTFHNLSLKATDQGLEAVIVFDV